MTYMTWLSILLMIAGSVLWVSAIDNQIEPIEEAKNAGANLFITGLVLSIVEQWGFPLLKMLHQSM